MEDREIVDLYWARDERAGRLPPQVAGILGGEDGLGDLLLRQPAAQLHRGVAQDQDGQPDARRPQGEGLVVTGDPQPVGPHLLHQAGHLLVPVAVGVGLDHRQQLGILPQPAAQGVVILLKGIQVHHRPAAVHKRSVSPVHRSRLLPVGEAAASPLLAPS